MAHLHQGTLLGAGPCGCTALVYGVPLITRSFLLSGVGGCSLPQSYQKKKGVKYSQQPETSCSYNSFTITAQYLGLLGQRGEYDWWWPRYK